MIAVAIMLISAIAGATIAYIYADGNYNVISNAMNSHPVKNSTNDSSIRMGAVNLFIHNVIADMFVIVGRLFFSIIYVILVIFNGMSIGQLFRIDLPYAITTIVPHGINEYFVGALSLAIAFKITSLEIKIIKNKKLKKTINDNNRFKRHAVIFIVMIVLLGIVAIIEAYITPMIAIWYFGL